MDSRNIERLHQQSNNTGKIYKVFYRNNLSINLNVTSPWIFFFEIVVISNPLFFFLYDFVKFNSPLIFMKIWYQEEKWKFVPKASYTKNIIFFSIFKLLLCIGITYIKLILHHKVH